MEEFDFDKIRLTPEMEKGQRPQNQFRSSKAELRSATREFRVRNRQQTGILGARYGGLSWYWRPSRVRTNWPSRSISTAAAWSVKAPQ